MKNKRIKTSEEKGKEIAKKMKKLIDNGDIKMVESDLNTPLKVMKAIPVTEKGKAFLQGRG